MDPVWPPDGDHERARCRWVIFYLALHFIEGQLHIKLPLTRDLRNVDVSRLSKNFTELDKWESSPFCWQRQKLLPSACLWKQRLLKAGGNASERITIKRKGGGVSGVKLNDRHFTALWFEKTQGKHFVPDNKSRQPYNKWANKPKMQSGMSEEKTETEITETDCKGTERST